MENQIQKHIASEAKLKAQAALQMNLFSLVDVGEDDLISEYSNAIGNLECIPRFLRGNCEDYLLSAAPNDVEVVNPYMNQGQKLNCHIKPAQIRRRSGGNVETYLVYPSDREEVVERTLFTIAANKGLTKRSIAGMPARFGVEFSIYEIREHLKSIGKCRSYDQIREALVVMRDSVTTITADSNESGIELKTQVFADSALDVRGTGRSRERCFVTFNDFVIKQIVELNFRQYSFKSIHSHKANMGTFMHSWLCDNWRNCAGGMKFKIAPELICQSYGKGRVSLDEMRRITRKGLKSLADQGMITHVPRLSNGLYEITATDKLAGEIFQSNAKHKGLEKLRKEIKSGNITELPDKNEFFLVSNN